MTPQGDCTSSMTRRSRYGSGPAAFVDEIGSVRRHASALPMVRFVRKPDLPLRKITSGKIVVMDDCSWIGLREPWERLKWSRLHWQTRIGSARTGVAAAESLGMSENTYTAYERPPGSSKHTPLTHQRAIQFGKKFKINWVWILSGEETPFERTDAQNRAIELMAAASEDDQIQVVDIIEAALRRKAG